MLIIGNDISCFVSDFLVEIIIDELYIRDLVYELCCSSVFKMLVL